MGVKGDTRSVDSSSYGKPQRASLDKVTKMFKGLPRR